MSLMAVSLFQMVLKEYHSEPSRAAAETGGECSLPRLGLFYTPALHGLFSHYVQHGTNPGFSGREVLPQQPQEPSLSQCELFQAATSGGALSCRDWK